MPVPPPPSTVRRTVRDAARIDRSLIVPAAGAVTALPVVLFYGMGLARWTPTTTSSLALGAFFVGLAARLNGPRLAPSAMVADAVGLAVSAVVGGLTAGLPWLHIATLVVWCFVGGLLVALGPGRSVVGVHGVMALIVFGRAPHSAVQSVVIGLLVLVGGLVQTGVQVVVRVPIGLGPQRRATAAVFRALAAGYGDPSGAWSMATADAVDAAARTLAPAALVVRRDAEALRGMLDEARRIRLELVTIEALTRRLPDDAPAAGAVDELRRLTDRFLTGLADALEHPDAAGVEGKDGSTIAGIRAAADALRDAVEQGATADADPVAAAVVSHFRSLRGQLRAAARLLAPATDRTGGPVRPVLARPDGGRRPAGLRSLADVLTEHLTWSSPALRHAVRLAVVVPALAVVGQHLGLGRSYWIPLSAAVVLRPDFAATMTRGLARVVGSVVGVGVVGALLVLQPGPVAATALVALSAWGAFAFVQSNYAVGVAFLTGLVLLLAGVGQTDTLGIAGDRLLDTVIGGAAALVAYVAWPTWSGAQARQLLARLVACQRAYAHAVLTLVTGDGTPPAAGAAPLRELARDTRLAYTEAQAAVARSLADPPSKRIDADLGRGVLAALRRVTRAVHGLRTELPLGEPLPGGGGLPSAVDAALARIGSALDGTDPGAEIPALRERYHRVDDATRDTPAWAGVVIHLDELVNAVDTAAELAARRDTAEPD